MSSHPSTYFEIQKYYQNKPRFNNGVYSRNNFPKIKDGAYVTNIDEYKSKAIHPIALFVNSDNEGESNNVTYFDSFGVEHIPKEIKTFISNRNITSNIVRMQAYDSLICGYCRIGFIDFMLKGKSL